MARFKDRQKAIELRKGGLSYSQIKKKLKVSKGTLSYWLSDYPLSQKRIRELRDWNEKRIERCRETKRKKKEKRLNIFYREQKKIIFPLTKRELFLTGLFLYWGEGAKRFPTMLSISNTDPSVIRFFIVWLNKSWNISKSRLRIYLHLYKDMDVEKEIQFWSATLGVPREQFTKPYIKESSLGDINHKGGFGHGTCNVRVGDARLSEKNLMALKAISDHYLKKKL